MTLTGRTAIPLIFRSCSAVALLVGVILGTGAATAQSYTEKVLHSFSGPPLDGAMPTAGVVLDENGGNVYGTTYYGGNADNVGTVYKVNKQGVESVLHDFSGHRNGDGANPAASLLLHGDVLYGTTVGGGHENQGTVFKVQVNGAEQVVYSFHGCCPSVLPIASLTMDDEENLYGTSYEGGIQFSGMIFKLDRWGHETTLFSFGTSQFGFNIAYPLSGVLLDHSGNLYGTTPGDGVVYRWNASEGFTPLHTFGAGGDGLEPLYGNLARDTQGNLYGTTYAGGAREHGTVFRVAPDGKETILHSFGPGNAYPISGLVEDPQGNLYGTTYQGGATGRGTVFKVTDAGTETVYTFGTHRNDGAYPMGTLAVDQDGNIYGTTQAGGEFGLGTVFKLTP